MLRSKYQSRNLIGHYHVLDNKPKKLDFIHQTVSRREARAGGAQDYDKLVTPSMVSINKYLLVQNEMLNTYHVHYPCCQAPPSFLLLAVGARGEPGNKATCIVELS